MRPPALRSAQVVLAALCCAASAKDPEIYRPKNSWRTFDILKRPLLDPIFRALISENAPLETYLRNMRGAPKPAEVIEWVDETLKSPVVIFTYAISPFCTEALKVLQSTGCKFSTVELGKTWFMVGTKGQAIRAELVRRTKQSSLPHVFIGGKSIGGIFTGGDEYPFTGEGLNKLVKEGTLMQTIRDAGGECSALPPSPPPELWLTDKAVDAVFAPVKDKVPAARGKAGRSVPYAPPSGVETPLPLPASRL